MKKTITLLGLLAGVGISAAAETLWVYGASEHGGWYDADKESSKDDLNKCSHETIGEFGAGRVMMKPAAPGTGIIAGGPVRAVMEAAGIRDIRAKCLRSNNPQNVVAATFEGLKSLRTPAEVAKTRGKSVEEILG